MDGSTAALSPGLVLLLAVLALVVPATVSIVVALIGRGGKSKPVELDTGLLMPRAEYDRLQGVCEP